MGKKDLYPDKDGVIVYQLPTSYKTKDTLFALAERVCISNEILIDRLKKMNVPMPFSPEHWNDYVKALCKIINRPQCPLCGAPVLQDGNRRSRGNPGGDYCAAFPVHSVFLMTWCDLNDENILKYLGVKCEHEYLTAECPTCIEKAKQEQRNKKGVSTYGFSHGYDPTA